MKKVFFTGLFLLCGCAAPSLYRPAERGDTAALRALLDKGADPNGSSGLYGNATALHMAAANSRLEAARLLIARGADVNREAVINRHRKARPIHYAACAGDVSMLRLLLDAGADPEPGGGECAEPGWTMLDDIRMLQPLALAEKNGHPMAAELLRSAIASKAGLVTSGGALKKIDTYAAVADSLLKGRALEGKALAVAGFAWAGGSTDGGAAVVSERLTTEFVKRPGLKVVERAAIRKMLEELKLQQSGAISQESAKRLGKLLGADWVAVGTLSGLPGGLVELNARLVDAESGEVLAAVTSQLERDWTEGTK